MPAESDLYATAVHEAGHAVIGRVLGFPCGRTSIKAKPGQYSGFSDIGQPGAAVKAWRQGGKRRSLAAAKRAKIIIYMAGGSAEEEFTGRRTSDYRDVAASSALLVSLMDEDDPNHQGLNRLFEGERLQRRLRRVAASLVRRHRERIEALARALLEKPVLADREIRDLIGMPEAPT